MLPVDFKEVQDKIFTQLRPWQLSFQFWVRAVDIYTGYKVFQIRVNFEKDAGKREAMWDKQHEIAADKIYNMCADLGGFFLKVAQIIGKLDLAPAAWVKRLVTLCDQAPGTSYEVIRVHRARLGSDKNDAVVKVQHPGVQELMMTDIHNLQAFALYMQMTDIKFDQYSVTKQMEEQIGYEFNFLREADAMEKI